MRLPDEMQMAIDMRRAEEAATERRYTIKREDELATGNRRERRKQAALERRKK